MRTRGTQHERFLALDPDDHLVDMQLLVQARPRPRMQCWRWEIRAIHQRYNRRAIRAMELTRHNASSPDRSPGRSQARCPAEFPHQDDRFPQAAGIDRESEGRFNLVLQIAVGKKREIDDLVA